MEATCSRCSFPIYAERIGQRVVCPACGFRGTAQFDEATPWLLGVIGAIVVIGVAAATKEKRP